MNKEEKLRVIIESVCQWNKDRFKRVYNQELSEQLLREEVEELITAEKQQDIVETLDALGDIFFVAIGSLWKFGDDTLDIYCGMQETGRMPEEVNYSWWLDTWHTRSVKANLYKMVNTLLCELVSITGNRELAMNVLGAICRSNHTKRIESLNDGSTKANKVKGDYYEAPTEDLKKVVKFMNRNKVNNNGVLKR